MGYFNEREGRRIDDKWMSIFLSLVSAALVFAVGLVIYFH
jgi:hypothetical protein